MNKFYMLKVYENLVIPAKYLLQLNLYQYGNWMREQSLFVLFCFDLSFFLFRILWVRTQTTLHY